MNIHQLILVTSLMVLTLSYSANAETDKHEVQGEHEENHVRLTADQLKNANIELAKVTSANIYETLPLYGVITVNAEHVYNMSARFPGVIRNINYKVGDKIQIGNTLAVIESNESLKNYPLTSSVRGIITERNVNHAGENTSDAPLFVITDFTSVWVEMAVFPRDFAKVQIGQTVFIRQAQTQLSTEGKIIYLSPIANSANQTLSARVFLDNAKMQWIPGSYVSANVVIAQTPVLMAVQNGSIQTLEEKTVVFVQGKEGFEPRPVQLGRKDMQWTEVLKGLESDEIYVSKNSFILKSDLGKEGAEHGH